MGYDQLTYYSIDIFRKADIRMDKYLLAIAMQTAPVFGYLLASVLLAKIKRRTQLITFGASFGITLMLLATNLYVARDTDSVRSFGTLLLAKFYS